MTVQSGRHTGAWTDRDAQERDAQERDTPDRKQCFDCGGWFFYEADHSCGNTDVGPPQAATGHLPAFVYGVCWVDGDSGEKHEEFDAVEPKEDPADLDRRTYVDLAEVREAIAWMGPHGQRAIIQRLGLNA